MTQPSHCFDEQASTPETCQIHNDKMIALEWWANWNGRFIFLHLLILLNINPSDFSNIVLVVRILIHTVSGITS